MPEIKSSDTRWTHADEIADWENHTIGMVQGLILEDFGDGESLKDGALDEKTIRTTYMGAGPAGEITPDPTDNYVPPHVDADTQVTAWRLRYPDLKSIEIAPTKEAIDEGNTLKAEGKNVGEFFRGQLFVRPGMPAAAMLTCGAVWTKGFQIGKRRMPAQKRGRLSQQFHELLGYTLDNMPHIRGTPQNDEGTKIDLRTDILERLERVRDELKGDIYHVDLPQFTIEVEDDEDEAPAPRPENTAASSAERDGFFPWASAGPSSIGATAIRQAKHGWPEEDYDGRPKYPFTQKRPHHVTGHFMIVVPDSDQAGPAVEAEVAQRVLNEFGRHTTRLHLACAAYSVKGDPSKYTPIPRQYVYDMLGMKWDQRSDLSRDEKDREVEKAIRNLRKLGVQISVLDGPDGAPAELGLESVWGINVVRWGQKRAVGADRILDTEHWQLMVRPNAWQQLYLNEESGVRQFGYFSRKLIENIDWANNPAAGDLAIELLKYVRFQDGGQPKDVRVETMLNICGLGQAKESWEQTRNRQKLERAILEQELWGWDVEWTRWPDAYRPDKENRPDFPNDWWQGAKRDDWECSFQDWKVTFYPPEDLAEMNSRAQKIDNSDPHELEPKGWPNRIKAILNETSYTQADLSRILEVSRAAVSQWKNGNRTPKGPHRAKLQDIERRNGLRKS